MGKSDHEMMHEGVLDTDIEQYLLETQIDYTLDEATEQRMRKQLLDKVITAERAEGADFKTLRASEGDWLEPLSGARIKILHQADEESDLLTYLARLDPGFEMQGHGHPFDEECLIIEGDLWLGDLQLKAGDYHFASKGLQHGRLRTESGALVLLKGALPA